MRLVVQRVSRAEVTVGGELVGRIGRGFLVLLGVSQGDTEAQADKLAHKLTGLRIFTDAAGKTNLSLGDVGGELLIISQFTLYADCRKGFRPSFVQAAAPETAEHLYAYFIGLCRESGLRTETGRFGAHMEVSLCNDGPFTVILEETA